MAGYGIPCTVSATSNNKKLLFGNNEFGIFNMDNAPHYCVAKHFIDENGVNAYISFRCETMDEAMIKYNKIL